MRRLNSLGFTFIELIVVIGILIVVMGGGIAGYRTFNERQILNTTGKEVLVALRQAQADAVAGVKSTSCANRTLSGNNFFYAAGVYYIIEYCVANGTTYTTTTKTVSIPNGLEIIIDTGSILFYGQYGGVMAPAQITVRRSGTTEPVYRIVVNSSGTVDDKGMQ